jgi:hypothetical protein
MDHKERIKQLAVEAKEWALSQIPAQGPEAFQSLRDEHFAQAVARDCAEICDHHEHASTDEAYSLACKQIFDVIRARFGLGE